MIDAVECMVIGSGALGSSAAFHLAKAGTQVALLDKHALGSQTSPRAAGLTSQARGTDLMTQLAKRAVRKIEAFEQETGEQIVFHQPGALKIARLADHVEQLKGEVVRGRRLATGIEMISPQEACRRGSISLICRSISAFCAGLPMPCDCSCQSSSACPSRSSCACIAADCRR